MITFFIPCKSGGSQYLYTQAIHVHACMHANIAINLYPQGHYYAAGDPCSQELQRKCSSAGIIIKRVRTNIYYDDV